MRTPDLRALRITIAAQVTDAVARFFPVPLIDEDVPDWAAALATRSFAVADALLLRGGLLPKPDEILDSACSNCGKAIMAFSSERDSRCADCVPPGGFDDEKTPTP